MAALTSALLMACAVWLFLTPMPRWEALDPEAVIGQATLQDRVWDRSRRMFGRTPKLEIAELLSAFAAELNSGQPLSAALTAACADMTPCPCPGALRAVGAGGDVPGALRRDSKAPGGADLASLAACWEVSADSGVGLAVAVKRLAESVRATTRAKSELQSELAATRATGRLLAGLPLFGLLLGTWIGADPLGWLLGSWPGRAILAAGLILQIVAMLWLRMIIKKVWTAL